LKNKNLKKNYKDSRHRRIRSKIFGTAEKPRISVFKSNKHIFVQFIDDVAEKTILSNEIKGHSKNLQKNNKTQMAEKIGSTVAKKAVEKGIKEAVFDRGGFKYHGRIKAVAESIRKGGIRF